MTLRLNTEATREKVASEKADVIIVAVGADPLSADLPGAEKAHVVWVGDVDAGNSKLGETVVVVGGGATGSEAALQLAKDGKKVTIIDKLDYQTLAADWPRGLSYRLEDYNVRLLTESKLEEINDTGAVIVDNKWKRECIPADTVILSLGFVPRSAVVDQFQDLAADVYIIGDCRKPQTIKEAVHDGFNTAVEI